MPSASSPFTLTNQAWTNLGAAPLTVVLKSKQPILVLVSDTAPTDINDPNCFTLAYGNDTGLNGVECNPSTPGQSVYARALNNYQSRNVDILVMR